MAIPTSKARTNGMTKNKPAGAAKPAMKPINPALSKLTSWVRSTYGVNLLKREETLAVAAYYGLRERLGMKLQTEIALKSNGSKRFDWSKWNSKVFPGIFGQPTKLKVSLEQMALVAAAFDHEISEDPKMAVVQLAEFNRKSLDDRKLTKAIKDELSAKQLMRLLNDKFGFCTVEEVRTAYLEQCKIRRSRQAQQALDDYNVEEWKGTVLDKDWGSEGDFLGTLDLIIFVEN